MVTAATDSNGKFKEELDVRVLRAIATPLADVLISRGCRNAGQVLSKPELLGEALRELRADDVDEKSEAVLSSCRKEVSSAWAAADSAWDLLQKASSRMPLVLPCQRLSELLGNTLRPGGSILEVCGVPGAGKTQLCLQICAAAQIPPPGADGTGGLAEAIFVDVEGCFVPRRYAQICRALLAERRPSLDLGSPAGKMELEAVLRGMHICRTFNAAELFSTVKKLGTFLQARPQVRALVVDSIAFCFRHEFSDNLPQRSRILADVAATLRRYGAEHDLTVVTTNHMTTRFDRAAGGDSSGSWLTPALGETWAHQPSTQLRLERVQHGQGFAPQAQPLGRATLTKSVEQATGRSCAYVISEVGIRDAPGGYHIVDSR